MHTAGQLTDMRLVLVTCDVAQPTTGDRLPMQDESLPRGGPLHNGPCCQSLMQVQDLVAASRRKDAFLALLGHELRNPLASIHQAIRLLRAQTGEAARQRTQAIIERQVCRMTRLINDLQEVSLITQGRVHLHRERVDLCSILRNAIETIQWDIEERKHRLTTDMPRDPVWLQGDAGRLEQVFVNLLANASRYTDAGGKLTVSLSAQATQAIVRIRDSGIGIAPDVLPRIFDLYKQANGNDPRSEAGLGVGLALVRHLVESHGGIVSAVSAGHGQGSEFTVCLRTEDPRDGR